jgi:hypothetical protein
MSSHAKVRKRHLGRVFGLNKYFNSAPGAHLGYPIVTGESSTGSSADLSAALSTELRIISHAKLSAALSTELRNLSHAELSTEL